MVGVHVNYLLSYKRLSMKLTGARLSVIAVEQVVRQCN